MCTEWQATPRIQACAFLTGLFQEIGLISLAQAAIQQNNFTAGWESLGDPGWCAVQAKFNLGVPYQIRTAFCLPPADRKLYLWRAFFSGWGQVAAETLMDNSWFMYMWANAPLFVQCWHETRLWRPWAYVWWIKYVILKVWTLCGGHVINLKCILWCWGVLDHWQINISFW